MIKTILCQKIKNKDKIFSYLLKKDAFEASFLYVFRFYLIKGLLPTPHQISKWHWEE